jgi:hypothetical protein
MNGAQALMKTLADAGVVARFGNSGNSEMYFVAALDHEPRMLVASRIVVTAGIKLFAEVCPNRIERGTGLSHVERLNKAR